MSDKICLNCGTPLTDSFCPHCGQKSSVGRLNIKTAVVDNTWSALRMDRKVLSTAWLLLTRPWDVIRGYIHGKRVSYTQPVRFIVIMCFVNILVQLFLPEESSEGTVATAAEGFMAHLWHSVQAFLRESEVAQDLVDSVLFAPMVYLLYKPWGSSRFNLAEYSTAYLYLCGTGLLMDLVLMPVSLLSEGIALVVQFVWWVYLLNGLVDRAFHITPRWKRNLMLFINVLLAATIDVFNNLYLYGRLL